MLFKYDKQIYQKPTETNIKRKNFGNIYIKFVENIRFPKSILIFKCNVRSSSQTGKKIIK